MSATSCTVSLILCLSTADSTLINGLGRSSVNLTAPLSIVNVVQGKRYRLRLVSLSCEPNYNFTIDQHNFTVIEADGVETKPLLVDSVQIFAGKCSSQVFLVNRFSLFQYSSTLFIGGTL